MTASERVSLQVIKIIDELAPDNNGYLLTAPELAQKVQAYLREQEPDLLDRWHEEMEYTFIRDTISRLRASRRAAARQKAFTHARRSLVAQAVAEAEGDISYKSLWDTPFFIDGVEKRLYQTNAKDNREIAKSYANAAVHNNRLALFHRRLAAKLGNKTVEEVLTPEQLTVQYADTVKPEKDEE